jgi:hypothetical protein
MPLRFRVIDMKNQNPDFAPVEEFLFNRVLSALDVAVLERSDNGDGFHLRGRPPEWWRQCVGLTDSSVLNPSSGHRFCRIIWPILTLLGTTSLAR